MIGKLLKAATVSTALLGSVAFVATTISPDVAYAKNGNSGGDGKGGGKGNGGGNGKAKEGGGAKGKSATSRGSGKGKSAPGVRSGRGLLEEIFGGKKRSKPQKTKTVKRTKPAAALSDEQTVEESVKPKARGNRLARELGVHPSELGALNAAHASPVALANASPNSRVGKIAIFAREVEAQSGIEKDLAAAREVLETMDPPERDVDAIDAAINEAAESKTALESQLKDLEADLEAAGGTDPDIESEITAVKEEIALADEEIADLEQERSDAEAYAAAEDEVDQLEADLEAQAGVAREALEDAANKEVTDEVEAAVRALLGLDQVVPELLDEPEVVVVE